MTNKEEESMMWVMEMVVWTCIWATLALAALVGSMFIDGGPPGGTVTSFTYAVIASVVIIWALVHDAGGWVQIQRDWPKMKLIPYLHLVAGYHPGPQVWAQIWGMLRNFEERSKLPHLRRPVRT